MTHHAITPSASRSLPKAAPVAREVQKAASNDVQKEEVIDLLQAAEQHAELVALALAIADSAARSDIEIYCAPQIDAHGTSWYDTDQLLAGLDRGFLDDSMRYLDMRGRMRRDPERPNVVAFLASPRACRACSCTQTSACPGGCYWVEEDLCSACAGSGGGDVDGAERGQVEVAAGMAHGVGSGGKSAGDAAFKRHAADTGKRGTRGGA